MYLGTRTLEVDPEFRYYGLVLNPMPWSVDQLPIFKKIGIFDKN